MQCDTGFLGLGNFKWCKFGALKESAHPSERLIHHRPMLLRGSRLHVENTNVTFLIEFSYANISQCPADYFVNGNMINSFKAIFVSIEVIRISSPLYFCKYILLFG